MSKCCSLEYVGKHSKHCTVNALTTNVSHRAPAAVFYDVAWEFYDASTGCRCRRRCRWLPRERWLNEINDKLISFCPHFYFAHILLLAIFSNFMSASGPFFSHWKWFVGCWRVSSVRYKNGDAPHSSFNAEEKIASRKGVKNFFPISFLCIYPLACMVASCRRSAGGKNIYMCKLLDERFLMPAASPQQFSEQLLVHAGP